MTTALIIGAHGFTARHLASRLAHVEDIRLVGVDIQAQAPTQTPLGEYAAVDVTDADQMARLVDRVKPDWVFDLAGLAGGDPISIYRVNLLGVVNLLEAVKAHAPGARVLLVGSAAEYGHIEEARMPVTEEHPCKPVGHYGISKHAATLAGMSYAELYGMKVVIARPFNIIGAGLSTALVVGAVIRRAREALESSQDPVVKIGNLDTERDFVAVEDIAQAYLRMINADAWGQVFNLCSERPRRIRDIVEMAISHSPRPIRLEVDPALLRAADVKVVYGSASKARQAFGFIPSVELEESLERAWDWEVGKGGSIAL